MNKGLLILFITIFSGNILIVGQAKKYILFEHFTNTDCNPCAQQNPIFQENILVNNKGNIHHIAYHHYYPGAGDPMYQYNITENLARINYYSINGVPTIVTLGTDQNSPANITQDDINNAVSESSPIRIKVNQQMDGDSAHVTVTVYTLGTPPSGSNLKIYAAVVESELNYTSAPGSNGETYFPNVFRDFLGDVDGDIYSPANQGDSVVYVYSYIPDTIEWDMNNIYVAAFVQNYSTKEVINSGSTLDPDWELGATSNSFESSEYGVPTTFDLAIYNLSDSSGNFRIYYDVSQPNDWSSELIQYAINSGDSVDITLPGNTTLSLQVEVTPGQQAGLGTFNIGLKSLDDASYTTQSVQFYLISEVTDLIISNSGAEYFDDVYESGLDNAGNTGYTVISASLLNRANKNNALDKVNNLYYNVAWTFPSLTDEIVESLEDFMDNGGNLFISGQDIGWDNYSGDGYGTSKTKLFYTLYLNAAYIDDGNNNNDELTPIPNEGLFGNLNNSVIYNIYNSLDPSVTDMYPDEIEPKGYGVEVFYYNNNSDKISGVRAEKNNFKVVYLGVGIEMLSDATIQDEILTLTHDWFYGYISSVEYDRAMKSISLNNYPNPANESITLSLKNTSDISLVKIYDMQGKLINQLAINGMSIVSINTSEYAEGKYMLKVFNEYNEVTGTNSFEVLH